MNDRLDSLCLYVAVKHQQKQGIGARALFESQEATLESFLSDIKDFAPGMNGWDALRRYHVDYLLPLHDAVAGLSHDEYMGVLDRVFGHAATPILPVAQSENWYQDYLNSFSPEEKQSLREDIEAVWERVEQIVDPSKRIGTDGEDVIECVPTLMNPMAKDRASGLVVGRIQSGKTRNYIGMALKAFCEGDWNAVIVLTSNNKALAWQTNERLREDIFKRSDGGITALYDFESVASGPKWLSSPVIGGNGRYLGLALKEPNHLRDIRQWLSKQDKSAVRNLRLLVIDDECDAATPDTQSTGSDKWDVYSFEAYLQTITSEFSADWLLGLRRAMEIADGRAEDDRGQNDNQKAVTDCVLGHLRNDEDADTYSGLLSKLSESDSVLWGTICGEDSFRNALGLEVEFTDERNHRARALDYVSDMIGRRPGELCSALRYLFDVELRRSTINHALCMLVSRFNNEDFAYKYGKVAYLGYTATPVANLVNEVSANNPLAPDFAYSMYVPIKYFGFKAIFGEPDDAITAYTNMPIVSWIPEDEHDIVNRLRVAKTRDDIRFDNDLNAFVNDQHNQAVEIGSWNTMKDAICWLFCTAAVRKMAWDSKEHKEDTAKTVPLRWTTMLINVNHRKAIHRMLQQSIHQYLSRMDDAQFQGDFVARCKVIWKRETGKLTAEKFSQLFPNYDAPDGYPSWEQVEQVIRKYFLEGLNYVNGVCGRDLGVVHVCNINSDADGKENLEAYKQVVPDLSDCHIWILCGGNTISRGLTLDGLTVSYFNRLADTTPADNVTQMGRWFGYRLGYELLPRAWMMADTVREFKDMCRQEEFLHKKLREGFSLGYSPKCGEHAIEIMTSVNRVSSSRMNAFGSDYSGFNSPDGTFRDLTLEASRIHGAVNAMEKILKEFYTTTYVNDPECVRDPEGNRDRNKSFGFYYKDVQAADILVLLGAARSASADSGEYDLLMGEVRRYPNTSWDIVINNPDTNIVFPFANFNQISVASATSQPINGGIRFGKIQNTAYRGNYANIEKVILNEAECNLLAKKISAPFWDKFPAEPDYNSREKVNDAIQVVRNGGYKDALPNPIRKFYSFVRMTGEDYRSEVFTTYRGRKGFDHNPILQITFIQPPEGVRNPGTKFPVLSYFWPGHPIDGFIVGSNRGELDKNENHDALQIAKRIEGMLDKTYHFLHRDSIVYELNNQAGAGNQVGGAIVDKALKYVRRGYGLVTKEMLSEVADAVYYSKKWCGDPKMFRRMFIQELGAFCKGNEANASDVANNFRFGCILSRRGRQTTDSVWADFLMFHMEELKCQ